VYIRCSKTWW